MRNFGRFEASQPRDNDRIRMKLNASLHLFLDGTCVDGR